MALSPKQKKIAKMAGDPNKIEGEDFKKLKTMKAFEGIEVDADILGNRYDKKLSKYYGSKETELHAGYKGDYKEDGMMFVGWYRFDPYDREYENSNLDTYNESFTYDFDDWDTTVDTIPDDLRDTWALDEEYENYKEEMEMEEDDNSTQDGS